ncbi:MAG: M18 family aminopeptidase [Clostridia bacterium]|nr:M18 family aminopeptidase [Clostridia bacterium]
MKHLISFLENSLTPYHAVANAKKFLEEKGFTALDERDNWNLKEGGKYFVTRNGSSLIAFTFHKDGNFKIVASHTDSPCLKLKESPEMKGNFTRLNVETYGGLLHYTFFDRHLRIAGRIVQEENGKLVSKLYSSEESVVIPSLAIHMNREANSQFAPDPQTDLLPLYALGDAALKTEAVARDLYVVSAEKPFINGARGEFLSSPRIDNMTSVCATLHAIANGTNGVCVAAFFDNEEIGSCTWQGAGSDFLKSTLKRISLIQGKTEEEFMQSCASSLLISLDNAHSVHPNHPEKCDPTNQTIMGGGIVIKIHANGAYTSDALTSAAIKTLFENAGVKYQYFFNRSDMKSGSTLGHISFSQVGIPSVDLGLAQLAMHSALETFAHADYAELKKGLSAFYQSEISIQENAVEL